MRPLIAALLLVAGPALGQDQQQALNAPPAPPPGGQAVFDIVAADRETAWRINRVTGEITVCRVDTTASLDGVRARCAPAIQETPPQQSQLAPGGIVRP